MMAGEEDHVVENQGISHVHRSGQTHACLHIGI
jgi:hypothetical protein